ncbi:lysoplasmalogenase [Streptomyces sp. ACA25]|uniref:lysoplasmalogenase n=1 Tax=Streptomyces sp. ACA25 TaxID=3022596 RepID=UPI0023078155|nr:lysoplasmalogenase [Streptomyces sp. ACA25]MDB1089759.1 lysoplasmalogenase [Streptomyces sp. ACA25]
MTASPHGPRPRLVFAVLAVTHLAAHLAGLELLQYLTKPLLMPALALWVLACRGPRLLVVALLFGWGGDVLLQTGADLLFLLGMASFGVGHLCYLTLFRRLGSFDVRRTALLAVGYGLVTAVVVVLLWPGLDPELRIPVAGYSLLLAVMACAALAGAGLRAGLGGALFLLSDTLIAARMADWPQLPAPGFWIMLTYLAAQYLLADALLRAHAASSSATSRAGATAR